jgi:DNA/RNA-binding domain of Phe-tRNA-synthetase-like protein
MIVRFDVEREILEAFPGIRIVVVHADGIDNARPSPEAEERWRAAWAGAAAAQEHGNAQSHPRVRPWRERMQAVGVPAKKFPTSIEALLRRAMKGGEPFSINPLVDFYNSVSLGRAVPAGGFDVAGLEGGHLALRRTRPGDSFRAIGAEAPEEVPPGEIAYTTASDVLTRHLVWRQSERAAIVPETREVILVSEILGDLAAEALDEVRTDLTEGLWACFGVEARSAVVNRAVPSAPSRHGNQHRRDLWARKAQIEVTDPGETQHQAGDLDAAVGAAGPRELRGVEAFDPSAGDLLGALAPLRISQHP